jgi:hypothetical protein
MRRSVLVLGLTLSAAAAGAQDRPWIARLQAGSATIHRWGRSGGWILAQVGRSFDGRISADLGLTASGSDEGYGSLTAGLEVLPFPRAIVSPFARGEVGVLGEPEYGGCVAGLGGGIAVRVNDRISFRAGATWNVHGGVRGPVVYYGGIEQRW